MKVSFERDRNTLTMFYDAGRRMRTMAQAKSAYWRHWPACRFATDIERTFDSRCLAGWAEVQMQQ
jgi:hypothetical protein